MTPRIVIGVAVFVVASLRQNECHEHLASLRKYTFPQRGMFGYLICPHYTCECLIYLSMAFTAAPRGFLLNRTLLCALIFVTVNLGATALGTKDWYEQRFGSQVVAGRWRMIPWIF